MGKIGRRTLILGENRIFEQISIFWGDFSKKRPFMTYSNPCRTFKVEKMRGEEDSLRSKEPLADSMRLSVPADLILLILSWEPVSSTVITGP